MHMFFHLGKDHNTYRFRCKHPNCGVEHYRKDQMENHHSKIHGKIEAEMMEDRSLELYEMCQVYFYFITFFFFELFHQILIFFFFFRKCQWNCLVLLVIRLVQRLQKHK